MSPRATRALAAGGIIGPFAFVVAWVLEGMSTKGYSPIEDAISELARTHAPTRVAMTLGFVAFGLGVISFGLALRASGAGPAGISAIATACFTLAVAATPLGAPARDVVHGTFASLGYVTLAGVPLLSVRPLRRAGRLDGVRASAAAATGAVLCLAASTIGPAHGLFQRAGLTIGDIWIVVTAFHLVRGHDVFATRSVTEAGRRT